MYNVTAKGLDRFTEVSSSGLSDIKERLFYLSSLNNGQVGRSILNALDLLTFLQEGGSLLSYAALKGVSPSTPGRLLSLLVTKAKELREFPLSSVLSSQAINSPSPPIVSLSIKPLSPISLSFILLYDLTFVSSGLYRFASFNHLQPHVPPSFEDVVLSYSEYLNHKVSPYSALYHLPLILYHLKNGGSIKECSYLFDMKEYRILESLDYISRFVAKELGFASFLPKDRITYPPNEEQELVTIFDPPPPPKKRGRKSSSEIKRNNTESYHITNF